MPLGNLVCGFVILGFSIPLYFYLKMQKVVEFGKINPNAWPSIILLGLMICGGLLVIRYLPFWIKERHQAKDSQEEPKNTRLTLILIFLSIGYIVFLKILGYLFATYLFLMVAFIVQGVRKKKECYLLPLLIVFLFTVGLVWIFYIPLPKGVSIFHAITVLVQ